MEHGLEVFAGVVKAAHDRADGAFHDFGDFLVGEALNVLEHDHLSVVIGKFAERSLDLDAKLFGGHGIVRTSRDVGSSTGSRVDILTLKNPIVEFARALQLAFAGPVTDEVVSDAVKPGGEAGARLELGQGRPGLDEDS